MGKFSLVIPFAMQGAVLTLRVDLFVCTKSQTLQVALCGDLPLVMPDSTSVGCRPALLCPAETRMIVPGPLDMPSVPESQLSKAESIYLFFPLLELILPSFLS